MEDGGGVEEGFEADLVGLDVEVTLGDGGWGCGGEGGGEEGEDCEEKEDDPWTGSRGKRMVSIVAGLRGFEMVQGIFGDAGE
jgi:hypothetical protein